MVKKRNLKEELKYLSFWEAFSAVLFAAWYGVAIYTLKISFNIIIGYPLGVLCLILIEGSFYWFNRLKRCQKKNALSPSFIVPLYRLLNVLNCILLVCYILIFAVKWDSNSDINKVIGMAVYVFALVEYINYYHVRLSYYTKSGYGLKIIEPMKNFLSGKAPKSQIAKEIATYKK